MSCQAQNLLRVGSASGKTNGQSTEVADGRILSLGVGPAQPLDNVFEQASLDFPDGVDHRRWLLQPHSNEFLQPQ